MDLNQLNTTLTGIENALLRRKCAVIEAAFNELDDAVEEAYEIEGQSVDTSASSGGAGDGYTLGREGDVHMDGGSTKTAAAEKAKAAAKAMQGGPGDKGTPQSTSGLETRAYGSSSKSREDRGDVDHGHA